MAGRTEQRYAATARLGPPHLREQLTPSLQSAPFPHLASLAGLLASIKATAVWKSPSATYLQTKCEISVDF